MMMRDDYLNAETSKLEYSNNYIKLSFLKSNQKRFPEELPWKVELEIEPIILMNSIWRIFLSFVCLGIMRCFFSSNQNYNWKENSIEQLAHVILFLLYSGTRSSNCNGANNSRRKMSRWDQSEPNHSNGSLLSTMERFVQTVDDMNETILVPCRLMDLQFDESILQANLDKTPTAPTLGVIGPNAAGSKNGGERVLANLNGVDLYQFYNVLNNIKNDLMWGFRAQAPQPQTLPGNPALSTSSSAASVISATSSGSSNASLSQVPQTQTNGEVKGHARRPSTVSTTSSTSASDTGNNNELKIRL